VDGMGSAMLGASAVGDATPTASRPPGTGTAASPAGKAEGELLRIVHLIRAILVQGSSMRKGCAPCS
jgi:hypothetical protein